MAPSLFTSSSCVVTPGLITALQQDNGAWASAVLSQAFSMPPQVQQDLLSGAAKWQIPNTRTLIITPMESR